MRRFFELSTGYAQGGSDVLAAAIGNDVLPYRVVDKFMAYGGQEDSLEQHDAFPMYSASQAISVAAAVLYKSKGCRNIGVIRPVCGFVENIFSNEGMTCHAVSEEILYREGKVPDDIDALYIALPNNPSGATCDPYTFKKLCATLSQRNIGLIADFCFRLYGDLHQWRQYDLLRASGVSFFGVEDTGKSIPMGGLKIGMLTCSADNRALVEQHAAPLGSIPTLHFAALDVALDSAGEGPDTLPMRQLVIKNRQWLLDTIQPPIRIRSESPNVPFVEISMRDGDWPETWLRGVFTEQGITLAAMNAFYGRDGHNRGLRLPLSLPTADLKALSCEIETAAPAISAQLERTHRTFCRRF